MTTNEEEYKHKQELLAIKRRAKRQLEKQAAQYGINVPQHISMGLEQVETDIKALEQWLGTYTETPSADVRESLGEDHMAMTVMARLKDTEKANVDGLTALKHETAAALVALEQKTEQVIGRLVEQVGKIGETVIRMDATQQEYQRREELARNQRQQQVDEQLSSMEREVDNNTMITSRISETIDGILPRVMGVGVLIVLVAIVGAVVAAIVIVKGYR